MEDQHNRPRPPPAKDDVDVDVDIDAATPGTTTTRTAAPTLSAVATGPSLADVDLRDNPSSHSHVTATTTTTTTTPPRESARTSTPLPVSVPSPLPSPASSLSSSPLSSVMEIREEDYAGFGSQTSGIGRDRNGDGNGSGNGNGVRQEGMQGETREYEVRTGTAGGTGTLGRPVGVAGEYDVNEGEEGGEEGEEDVGELEQERSAAVPVDSDDSMFQETLQLIPDDELAKGSIPGAVTLAEAHHYRTLLRTLGKQAFIATTVLAGTISARKLCTAFKIRCPDFMADADEDALFYPLLRIGIEREYARRTKLPQFNTVGDAVDLLRNARNVVVLTGAGISTSLGIPDFRSKNTGLYTRLAHLGLNDPQEVFDIDVFREDPTIFYSIAHEILPRGDRYTPTHAFIRLLQDKGKLLTNFTQNIDNLEGVAGIVPEKIVQCHGSFATATCVVCGFHVRGEEVHEDIRRGRVPQCPQCVRRVYGGGEGGEQGSKRKRGSKGTKRSRKGLEYEDSSEEEDYSIPVPGVMKPDITFFGEDLPDRFDHRLMNHDRHHADLVIVIGTSLKVAPVSEVPGILRDVPQIFINRDPVSHIDFDIEMLGNCDTVVSELCRRAGWELKHEMIPEDEKVEVTPVEECGSRWRFTSV